MKRNKDVSSHTCSPSFWGRTEHKNRNKRVKWKRINEGDYSGERQESWRLTLKASFLSFSAQRDGVMEESFSPMTLALISKFFLPERWRSRGALHFLFPWSSSICFTPSVVFSPSYLTCCPLLFSSVCFFVSGGRITCFSTHPSNVIGLKHAVHLAFNHFPLCHLVHPFFLFLCHILSH